MRFKSRSLTNQISLFSNLLSLVAREPTSAPADLQKSTLERIYAHPGLESLKGEGFILWRSTSSSSPSSLRTEFKETDRIQ